MVDKNAVAFVGKIKRNIFIGLFGACAAVFIIDFYGLSVFDKRRKTFSRPVKQFSDADV